MQLQFLDIHPNLIRTHPNLCKLNSKQKFSRNIIKNYLYQYKYLKICLLSYTLGKITQYHDDTINVKSVFLI